MYHEWSTHDFFKGEDDFLWSFLGFKETDEFTQDWLNPLHPKGFAPIRTGSNIKNEVR